MTQIIEILPESKVHGANMGPTWVLSASDGPHVGPMNLAIRASSCKTRTDLLYIVKIMGAHDIDYVEPILLNGTEVDHHCVYR